MIRSLHERQLLFPVVVALVVVGVLIQGALQPGEPAQATDEFPSSDPAPVPIEPLRPTVVRADLEKTPLTYVSDYWAQLATQVRPSLTLIGDRPFPAILVGPRLAVTTADAAAVVVEARESVRLINPVAVEDAGSEAPTEDGANRQPGDSEIPPPPTVEEVGPYALRGWDDELGLALFDLAQPDGQAFTLTDPRGMPSGSYVGAVTLAADGTALITPGHLITTGASGVRGAGDGDLVVSMDLPAAVDLAAVVNLDGALVGLAYTTEDGHRVISSTELLTVIGDLQRETVCRSIEVADLDEVVSTMLALQTGVLVEFVHVEAFDPEPSVRAGDVLLEWASEPVGSATEFAELYDAQEPGALVPYLVLRSGRRVSGRTIMPGDGCEPAAPAPVRLARFGFAVRWVPSTGSDAGAGWQVAAVAADGPAAEAGLIEGDWLVTVDRRAVRDEQDRQTLERAAGRSEPLLILLRRDDRAKLVAVSPVEPDA